MKALESIPQIPIHVTEIKKLIIKDNLNSKTITSDNDLDEERLLSVLTHGSTGRNPTFFKAYGHNDVFGLRVAIPEGCTTLEVAEDLPSEDPGGMDESGAIASENQNVLYVQLPDGHPVITGAEKAVPDTATMSSTTVEDSEETPPVMMLCGKSAAVQPSLSFEEAVEQAELIFDDGENVEDITQIAEEDNVSSNLVSSSSGTPSTASTCTTNPDLKPVPVLSMTNEHVPIVSNIPLDQTSVLVTATPAKTLTNELDADSILEKEVHVNEESNILEGREERMKDKSQISNDVNQVQQSGQNKCAVTLVQVTNRGSASKDSLNVASPELTKTVLEIDTTLKTRSKKGETCNVNTINNDPIKVVCFNAPPKGSSSEYTKQAGENPATAIVSITSNLEQIAPVNKKQKAVNEVREQNRKKEKPISELEVVSNSVMVMTNVQDEIEIDGADNTNRSMNTSSGREIVPLEGIAKGGLDTTDGKAKYEIKDEVPIVPQAASEDSRHHNLRPKRSLRHVHALKQQAKRRKRNTSIAAAATSSGAPTTQMLSNTPDPSTISIQRTTARKPSIGKDNGGKKYWVYPRKRILTTAYYI